MVFKFSVWLRETARLYLRYMALGLVGVPFALIYAVAAQAGWRLRILLPLLAGCGFITARWAWRGMGDWQVSGMSPAIHSPQPVASPFETGWAEMLRVTIESSAPLQYRATIDEDTLRTWNEVLAPAFLTSHEVKMIQTSLSRAHEPAPVQMLMSQPTAALQQMQMLTGQSLPLHSKPKKPSASPQTSPESTLVSAFALSRQVGAGAHGLA